MADWGKIAVAVRCGVAADPLFFVCWTRLLMSGLRPGDTVLAPAIELPQHYAAEALARSFLQTEADTIFFVDDDMTFMPADLAALRDDAEGQEYDMLQALCLSRNPPHYPVINEPVEGTEMNRNSAIPARNTIVDVSLVGLAFTLIRRRVFAEVDKTKFHNTFYFSWNARGDSEDAGFSYLARKAGCKIGVNTRVSIGHRIPTVLKWDIEREGISYETQFQEIKQANVIKRGDMAQKEDAHGWKSIGN